MVPGEYFTTDASVTLNEGREAITLEVTNTGDRAVQVGSHFHFAETNSALTFDRQSAVGKRLDIPAGTAVRFEPGDTRSVRLIDYVGTREVYGFNGLVNGHLNDPRTGKLRNVITDGLSHTEHDNHDAEQ